MITVVFNLSDHNFIDQIAPLIDYLAFCEGYAIVLLKTRVLYDYETDKNLDWLTGKYPEILVKDLFDNKNKYFKKLLQKYFKLLRAKSQKRINIINKFGLRILGKKILREAGRNKSDLNSFFSNLKQAVYITELSGDYYLNENRLNIPVINLLHGFYVFKNKLISRKMLKHSIEEVLYKYTSKCIVFNYLTKKYICENGVKGVDVIQLPSLRFSREWTQKKIDCEDSFYTDLDGKDNLRIVLMCSNQNYNIWLEELERSIEAIVSASSITLVVKPHPRDIDFGKSLQKMVLRYNNLKVVSNSVVSSVIVHWADLVLCVGSGIFVDALVQRKPVGYIKYLHCNETALDSEDIVYILNTRDQLVDLISKNKDEIQACLNPEKIDNFLKDYIGTLTLKESCELYKKEIEKIIYDA